MRKHTIVVVGLALMAIPLHAEIYKWTDSDGNVHFSDKPHSGAEKVTLPPVQTYSPPSTLPIAPGEALSNTKNGSNKKQTSGALGYDTFTFIQPTDQLTVRDNSGNMSAIVQLEPSLRPGDAIQLIMDDEPVGEPQTGLQFDLTNVDRGSHTISAKVINANGDEVATADPITFFMHRARAGGGD